MTDRQWEEWQNMEALAARLRAMALQEEEKAARIRAEAARLMRERHALEREQRERATAKPEVITVTARSRKAAIAELIRLSQEG